MVVSVITTLCYSHMTCVAASLDDCLGSSRGSYLGLLCLKPGHSGIYKAALDILNVQLCGSMMGKLRGETSRLSKVAFNT